MKSIPIASLCANLIDIPYSIYKRRSSGENLKSYYTSRAILSFLRSVVELPFLNPELIRFNKPLYFLYFTTGETVFEGTLEQFAKFDNRPKVEPEFKNTKPMGKLVKFCYIDEEGNEIEIPEKLRFEKATKVREDGTKVTFYDTKNPKKVSDLEMKLYRLQKKAGISSIRRMKPGESLGICDAIRKISTPPPSKAELDFFRLRDELERPEDYGVNIVTRYCGLQLEPKEGTKLEEVYTKEIECPHEPGYCGKCEITKDLKDKVQKLK